MTTFSTPDNDIWQRINAKASARRDIKQALDLALEALDQCEDYFDKRQDADCDQDGFIPNEEMKLLSTVSKALAALSKVKDAAS